MFLGLAVRMLGYDLEIDCCLVILNLYVLFIIILSRSTLYRINNAKEIVMLN